MLLGVEPPSLDASSGTGTVHWEVVGRYVDACCDVECAPQLGTGLDGAACALTAVFQIEYGIYDGVSLDNLTVIVVTNDAFVRFYLDERTSSSQRVGLEEVARMLMETSRREGFIFPADQAVQVHSMEVELSDEEASVLIPGVLELRAHSLVGGDGEGPIRVLNLDLGPTWMTDVWLGQSEVYRYSDNATWDHTGSSARFGRFDIMGMLR